MTEHHQEPARDYAADPERVFFVAPKNRSKLTIGGPNCIVIVSAAKCPNLFWRTMQRWLLGFVWEEIDE